MFYHNTQQALKPASRITQSILVFISFISLTQAFADSTQVLSLLPGEQKVQLRGVVSHTLYRTEEYYDTCSREVEFIDHVRRCEARYQRVCENIVTRECDPPRQSDPNPPACRDVVRPVCKEVRVADYCWMEAVRRIRTEYFTCVKTRQVPDGVHIDADRIVSATLKVSGDVGSLSAQDRVAISVANGNDIHDSGVSIALHNAAHTHLIYLQKLSETERAVAQNTAQVDTVFEAKVIAVSRFKAPQMRIESVSVSSADELAITVMGDLLDSTLTSLSLNIDKDQTIGGWKNVHSSQLALSRMSSQAISGGQILKVKLSALGVKINKRPHRVKVALATIAAGIQQSGLANPQTLKAAHLIAEDHKEAKFRR